MEKRNLDLFCTKFGHFILQMCIWFDTKLKDEQTYSR